MIKEYSEAVKLDILVNTILGGYRLKRLLGSGGMGSVYLAEDEAIGQQVAIKVIRGESDDSDPANAAQAAERFRREARAVASLDHLHILPLYRYGEEEAGGERRAYMIMQYRPEGSLWDWLRRRARAAQQHAPTSAPDLPDGLPTDWPLSLKETTDYVHQAASALQYAHEQGIVHRDVKPANFLLRIAAGTESAGSPFLLLSDFGLAKLYSVNTGSSQVFGTPTYMAPEQFEGVAGPACDQYALAVMAYYFLAGRPPFEGEPMQMMHKHLSVAPPPIRQFAPRVPVEVERALARALAKKPVERFPTIADFASAFSQPDSGRAPLLLSPGWSPRSAGQFTPAGPGVQLSDPQLHESPTVASAVPLAHSSQPSMGQAQMGMQTPSWQTGFPPANPAAAPTGSQPVNRRSALSLLAGGALIIAAGATIGGGAYFMIVGSQSSKTGSTNSTPSPAPTATATSKPANPHIQHILKGHTSEISGLSWSASSAQLVSASQDATARLWRPEVSEEAVVVYQSHQQAVTAIAWDPTSGSTRIASGSADTTLQIWNTEGMQVHKASAGSTVSSIGWETSGTKLLLGTLEDGIREYLLSSGHIVQIGKKSAISALAISPNKRYLAVGSSAGYISIYELSKFRAIYSKRNHTQAVKMLAWSSSGTQLASAGADKSAQILTISSKKVVSKLPHQAAVNGVAWEPGGTGRFATGAADGILRVWSAGGKSHTTYEGHKAAITTLAWSKYGLATGSSDATIITWRV
ncbi:MAG: serine/threonine protein kinase [Ktedonobacteraceae bacterium]|nr:serine/threonine protein kinase [Ktedonobacteraceae bacterium]